MGKIKISFSLIVGLVSLFIAIFSFFPTWNEQGWIGVLFLGILALLFLVYSLYLIDTFRKKTRYTIVPEKLNIGFAELLQIERKKIKEPGQIKNHLVTMCDCLSELFSFIYEHQISTCIKLFVFGENDHPRVTTLVRDKNSSTKRKDGKADTIMHWVNENTDFKFIYQNLDDGTTDTSFFHNNNLPACNYTNTRMKPGADTQKKDWTLPYKSTIVVPIVPLLPNEQNKTAIRGFLCVDSPKINIFERY